MSTTAVAVEPSDRTGTMSMAGATGAIPTAGAVEQLKVEPSKRTETLSMAESVELQLRIELSEQTRTTEQSSTTAGAVVPSKQMRAHPLPAALPYALHQLVTGYLEVRQPASCK